MRFTLSAVVAFAASLAFVQAQDLGNIPDCALTCFAIAVPASGCSLTDTKCQCTTGQASITKSLTSCVPSKCSADDIAKIAPAVADICAKAGISLSNLPTSAASATSSATATGHSNSTSSNVTRTASPSSASGTGAAQSTGGAVANVAGFGAIAVGMLAAFGL